jgi:hypothetical protein
MNAAAATALLRASNPAARLWIAQGGTLPALPSEAAAALQDVLHGGPDYRPGSFEKALLLRVDGGQELDLARLEADQARRQTEQVEVAALIEAVVNEAGPLVSARG